MLLTGQVYDNETGKGIPYASVQITDDGGTQYLGGVAADLDGLYIIDSPILNDGKPLYVTSTGYLPVLVNDEVYTQNGMIGLDRTGSLPVVYVTPQNNTSNQWMIWLLFGGGLAVLLAAGNRKKKVGAVAMTKVSENEWIDIAIKIGIPVAIYFLVVKPILVALNLLPDKSEQQQNQSDQQAQTQQQQLGTYNSNDNHNHTAAQMDSVAVALRNATASWSGYDWNIISQQLTWIPGMTSADARYFLGTFAKRNGITLYRWYQNEFIDAYVWSSFSWNDVVWENGWGGTGGKADYNYSAYYAKMGINESNAANFSWEEVVDKFISYVYSLAGVAKQ